MKNILIVLLFGLTFFSCEKEKEIDLENFNLATESRFRLGNDYISDIQSVQFRISEISDSRCPSDLVCFWQGEAVVTIDVQSPIVGSMRLNTNDNQKDTLGNYSFELVDVAPYPISAELIGLEDYEITLIIEKLE